MTSEWTEGLLGGVLIGLASALLLLTHGRIAGISGILGGLLTSVRSDRAWRLAFLVALTSTGFLLVRGYPERFRTIGMPGWPVLLIAGLLVGFGTRLGGGCTSGHGVCGLSRGSPRSLAATLTFMATAIVTVLITRHFL
ncbi:MAG: YeeE/YedE family protein [Myxococcaceae bacterium]|nr:YeeE/YedE family protein [Myxococcaceae bacterium]